MGGWSQSIRDFDAAQERRRRLAAGETPPAVKPEPVTYAEMLEIQKASYTPPASVGPKVEYNPKPGDPPKVDLAQLVTFNQLGDEMLGRLVALLSNGSVNQGAKREFAIAKTAIEDALTRHNAGYYRQFDEWKRGDPEERFGSIVCP